MGLFKKAKNINWIEINAKIIDCQFSTHNWGTEVSHAKGEAQNRIKLKVEFQSTKHEIIIAQKSFWINASNTIYFQKEAYVSILYNQDSPQQFKLKYPL
ncbi:MAG: hypothetical protein LKF42_04935 [Streptococcaceae bacterium]|jgi:hypothetical protein|nr:hypothetical protein [Streptococcaceae bacterium]MCH4176712.1 hypothetical protein [Streptococcaceae bacterium]